MVLVGLFMVIVVVRGNVVMSDKWELIVNEVVIVMSVIFNEMFVNIKVVWVLILERYFFDKYIKFVYLMYFLGYKWVGFVGIFYGFY